MSGGRRKVPQRDHPSLWPMLRSSYVAILTLCFTLIAPSFPNTILHYYIEEELPLYTEVGNLRLDSNISVISSIPALDLRFSLLGDPERDVALRYLSVNATSSVLYISRLLDREEVCDVLSLCQLTFGVAAHAGQHFYLITVHVEIEDLNDNIPTFSKDGVSIAINENTPTGMRYTLPSAVDKDSGEFGVQRYTLESSYGVFGVEYQRQVKLVVAGSLDREKTGQYLLHLLAYDGGFPPNAGLLFINVTVVDRNDNLPVFNTSNVRISVPENTPVPSPIGTVQATDADFGNNGVVRYALSQASEDAVGYLFETDPLSGEIYLVHDLDFEAQTSYSFEVKAYDMGATSHSSFATVAVEVEDINDNAPRITISSLSNDNLPVILENSSPGVFVAHVTVSDDDSGVNGDVTCDIISDHFRLDSLWGSQYQVVTAMTFDREEKDSYEVMLACIDHGKTSIHSNKSFWVFIGDENDNRPVFSQQVYTASVYENNPLNDMLLSIAATDVDVGENGRINYTVQGLAAQLCYVEDITGAVRAKVRLDYEQVNVLEFNVVASDSGSPALSAITFVNLTVKDVNDEPPIFLDTSYTFTAPENQPGGRFVGAVSASDPDTVSSPQDIRYFFQLGEDLETNNIGAFRLNAVSGQIETNVALDREDLSVYEVTVASRNTDNISLTSTVQVTIRVRDENDNQPVFQYPTAENNTILLSGNLQRGSPVATLRAADQDTGENAELSYTLLDSNADGMFIVETDSGDVVLYSPPAGDGFLVYQLEIMARDNGIPRRNSTTFFYVVINGTMEYATPTTKDSWPAESPKENVDDRGGSSVLTGSSLTAFICIVSIAGVMISLLVAAIIFVLWRGKRRKRQGQQQQEGYLPGSIAIIGTGSPDNLNNNGNQINASYQSADDVAEVVVEDAGVQGRPSGMQSQGRGRLMGMGGSPNGGTNLLSSPVNKAPNYIEVRRFLDMLESDEDSEELSNADSGNGTSLEGETPTKKRRPGQAANKSTGIRPRRLHSTPQKTPQAVAVTCPAVMSLPAALASGSHASNGPIREVGRIQIQQGRDSVSSAGSDEVFANSDSPQPKHGILKTKLQERRLKSRGSPCIDHLHSAQTTPQARVHFQPHPVEAATGYLSPPRGTVDGSAVCEADVINLDNHEMEITI